MIREHHPLERISGSHSSILVVLSTPAETPVCHEGLTTGKISADDVALPEHVLPKFNVKMFESNVR